VGALCRCWRLGKTADREWKEDKDIGPKSQIPARERVDVQVSVKIT